MVWDLEGGPGISKTYLPGTSEDVNVSETKVGMMWTSHMLHKALAITSYEDHTTSFPPIDTYARMQHI